MYNEKRCCVGLWLDRQQQQRADSIASWRRLAMTMFAPYLHVPSRALGTRARAYVRYTCPCVR